MEVHTPPSALPAGAAERRAALSPSAGEEASPPKVAHTLTACTRCRQRKTRCDPGLPRCGPCERTNAVCEYWDPAKRTNIKRDYVVWLQHRVNDLEKELDRLENEDLTSDPELMMRSAATVKLQDTTDTKFLGPSSGTQLTRLVMQLAKQFTDAKTIKEVVPEAEVRKVQDMIVNEDKPTSKVYPLISSVAAEDLPNSELVQLLYQVYCLKVQPMYPALHEPTLAADMHETLQGTTDPYKNFITRMMIAISLQKMDTQYAGLADSYYLAALKYMEAVVKHMDLRTLQAFALVAEYSLLTPTRTAIYYIVGLAVRLVQALGIHEEASITRGDGGRPADPLEIDMRRRLFWCIFTMEAGLSHALGRPMALAYGRAHFDVSFFELCDDTYITREGILPGARPCLKKWIAVHFFKMRLIQLEIRRTLYLNKQPTPKDHSDPWFQEILAKMDTWADATPDKDEGMGLDKIWFKGRYNTMIVFLYRPSPQIPKPCADAAHKCFEASKYNIFMTKEQILRKNVDVTWIFTQAIFMAINTLLWSLSYEQVRKNNPRPEVEQLLNIGLESIKSAADRWPGVLSAHTLYVYITKAILRIYDKDGDVTISTGTPSEGASPGGISDAASRSYPGSPASSTVPRGLSVEAGLNNNMPAVVGVTHEHQRSTSQHLAPPASSTGGSSGYAAHNKQGQPTTVPRNSSGQQPVYNHVTTQFQTLPNDFESIALSWQPHQGQAQSSPIRPSPTAYRPYHQVPGQSTMSTPTGPSPTSNPYFTTQPLRSPLEHPTSADLSPYDYSAYQGQQPAITPPLYQQASMYLDPHYWEQVATDPQGGNTSTPGSYHHQRQQQQHPHHQQHQQQQHYQQMQAQQPWGLNESQQLELLQNLETAGVGDIETIIAGAERFFNPRAPTVPG